MNDTLEFWLVEQFVELGNESFWHEKARLHRAWFVSEEDMKERARLVGERDVAKHGGRYRIRVVKEETVFDSEEG
ncbi:hypothetical protein [Streptomyces althioticus]|uniref:hypothetical protein n=1 Tax=Streptomyces althioticus TaxID=83380 RepID=UPI0033E386A1